MIKPEISVIIPVRNGSQTLERCLTSIRSQTIQNIEIIILDSMSTDNSRQIADLFNVIIIDIPPGTFNHGLTRNIGTTVASANFLFFTVQDAWLSENNILERMLEHFSDKQVMGVVGHQAIPWGDSDKNPAYWFKRYSEPKIHERFFSDNSFQKLSKKERFKLSYWDDVVAMYRKIALVETPFKETNFSEDWLWASEALKKGYKILADPSLVVYHYHHLNFNYRFKADFTVNYHFYKFFDEIPAIPYSPMKFLRSGFAIFKRKEVELIKKPYWILHNLGISMADFFSVIIFRTLLFFGGDKLLAKGYNFFCKDIPQGKLSS